MGLLDTSLEVLKLAGKVANPELVEAATKANIEALELSQKNLEFQKKVTELEAQIEDLKAKLVLQGEVFRANDLVFRAGDPDPYCSRCWDAEHKLIHIIRMFIPGRGTHPGCPECKTGVMHLRRNPFMEPGP